MSTRVRTEDGQSEPSSDAAARAEAAIYDLDLRLGLSSFGSEIADAPGPVSAVGPPPPPTPLRPPPVVAAGPAIPVPPRPAAPAPIQPPAASAPVHVPPHARVEPPPLIEPQPRPAPLPGAAPEPRLAPPRVVEPVFPREPRGAQPAAPTRPPEHAAQGTTGARHRLVPALAVIAILAIVSASIWAQRRPAQAKANASTGEVTIDSTPAGARVIVGGKDLGTTPLSLTLVPGTYEVELRAGDERHVMPILVKAGATTAQHVFLRKGALPGNGTLRISSEPPAASVAVDGRRRGTTPLLITDLAPGPHDLIVTGTSGGVRQRVQVDPAATTTVMVPLPKPSQTASMGGWLSVTAPIELQVFEGDRLLGTTRVHALMLPTGAHTLRFSNDAAGIDVTRQVTILHGHTERLEITLPPGTLSINAVPWATVSIDGREVGETPLGGIELSPGPHEVVLAHPELGERRQQVTIRAGGASRVSVDLRH